MEKEKKNKKQVIIGVSILLLVTLLLLGLTYAYYRTRIVGNTNSESISVTSQNLEIKYQDGDSEVITGTVEPGNDFTKKFSVTNTGDGEAKFSIKIEDVTNTFNRVEDWTYKIYKLTNENDTSLEENKVIKSGMLPNTESWLVFSETIGDNETNYYNLTITYANSTEDQSEDMGKELTFKVNIGNEVGETFTQAGEETLLAAIGKNNAISEPLTVPGQSDPKVKEPKQYKVYGMSKDSALYAAETNTDYFVLAESYTFDEHTGKYTLNNPRVEKGLKQPYTQYNGLYFRDWPSYSGNPSEDFITGPSDGIHQLTCTATSCDQYWPIERQVLVEKELSYTEDDNGTSYYYRGGVENNYLNFGGMCWRIVRVQGDGSIKIILADENNNCNAEGYSVKNTTSAFIKGGIIDGFNFWTNEADYGKFKESNIPNKLSEWMTEKSLTSNNNIVTNAKWCNDLSITSKTGSESTLTVTYGASKRLNTDKKPSLKCDFTGIEESEAVEYEGPAALLTADEVYFAGILGSLGTGGLGLANYLDVNANGYLNPDPTMTPMSVNMRGTVMFTSGKISLSVSDLDSTYYKYHLIRPVVVLKSTTNISKGDGTQKSPYEVS